MKLGCDLYADAALDRRKPARLPPRQPARRAPLGLLALLGVAIAVLLYFTLREDPRAREQARELARVPWTTDTLVVDPRFLKPVDAAEAQRINAAMPVSGLPVVAARPLAVPPSIGTSWDRSVECLTQAIYYEAATEPDDGKRAVAQVVLNRVRHPAFPNSVCGVVYQGSTRSTGCQFSFTCDGSLARIPMAGPWIRSRQLAVAALSGYVYPSVGLSTFYHADYVAPYWAPSLAKVTQIGRHIFYRWRGNQGEAGWFSARYAGIEPDVAQLMAAAYSGAVPSPTPTEAASDVAAVPIARPILSSDATHFDGGTAPSSPAAPAGPAGSRWLLGMDGPARPAEGKNESGSASSEPKSATQQ